MPAGIRGTLAIGKAGAKNAALLAIAILADNRARLREKLQAFRDEQKRKVLRRILDRDEDHSSRLDHRRARQRTTGPHVRHRGAAHGLSRSHFFAGPRFAHRPDRRRGNRRAYEDLDRVASLPAPSTWSPSNSRMCLPRPRRPRRNARWFGPRARFCTSRSTGCARRRSCATTDFP